MPGTILVTGANRGIGLALSIAFAKAAWAVFAGARNPGTPALENAARAFSNLRPVALDVLDDVTVGHAADLVARGAGSLDVLVNNAAIFPGDGDERLEDLDLDWFNEAVATNVTGVARVTRAFLPALRRGARPRIVNISSGAGSISDKDDHKYYPYSVSKAGLNMLTRAMAAEFRPEGIIVAAISPGWVKTEMGGENATIGADESAASLLATIGRLTPEDSGTFMGRDGGTADYAW